MVYNEFINLQGEEQKMRRKKPSNIIPKRKKSALIPYDKKEFREMLKITDEIEELMKLNIVKNNHTESEEFGKVIDTIFKYKPSLFFTDKNFNFLIKVGIDIEYEHLSFEDDIIKDMFDELASNLMNNESKRIDFMKETENVDFDLMIKAMPEFEIDRMLKKIKSAM